MHALNSSTLNPQPSTSKFQRKPLIAGRIAALMALSVTMEYFSSADIARRVLPSVGMCAVDPQKEVWLGWGLGVWDFDWGCRVSIGG